jgi:hypothetical protein
MVQVEILNPDASYRVSRLRETWAETEKRGAIGLTTEAVTFPTLPNPGIEFDRSRYGSIISGDISHLDIASSVTLVLHESTGYSRGYPRIKATELGTEEGAVFLEDGRFILATYREQPDIKARIRFVLLDGRTIEALPVLSE